MLLKLWPTILNKINWWKVLPAFPKIYFSSDSSMWWSHLWVQSPCTYWLSSLLLLLLHPLLHSGHRGHTLVGSQTRPSCWGLGRLLTLQSGTSEGRLALGYPEFLVVTRWDRTWQVSEMNENISYIHLLNEFHNYKKVEIMTTAWIYCFTQVKWLLICKSVLHTTDFALPDSI